MLTETEMRQTITYQFAFNPDSGHRRAGASDKLVGILVSLYGIDGVAKALGQICRESDAAEVCDLGGKTVAQCQQQFSDAAGLCEQIAPLFE